jgi:hypothetical protein
LLRTAQAPWSLVAAALLAAPSAAATADDEPTLVEAQQVAAKRAAGEREEDRSRVHRARVSHWAPVIRGLLGGREDERVRDGEARHDPLRWTDRGQALTWGVQVTWDLPQLIFARDETQLVHAQLHLEKARQAAARETVRLYLERREKQRALAQAPPETRPRLRIEIVKLTAELDSLTGGLFRASLAREEAAADRPPPLSMSPLVLPPAPKETR